MIPVNIKGTVKEILFSTGKTCGFIISNEHDELMGTITTKRLELADKIELGREYSFTGNICLYRRTVDDRERKNNVFYVTNIKSESEEN